MSSSVKQEITSDSFASKQSEESQDKNSQTGLLSQQSQSTKKKKKEEVQQILLNLTYTNNIAKIQKILNSEDSIKITEIADNRQYTLAHICALNNNISLFQEYIQYILKQKIETNQNFEQIKESDLNQEHPELIIQNQLLIKNWINLKNDEGFVCLHFASFKGNLEFIRYLESQGADIHVQNNNGLNLLHISAQGDQPVSLYYWKIKGLDLNSIDNKGSTPLHWAAYMGCENALNFLVCWNVNINQQDIDGKYTPLHLSVVSGNSKVVRKLLIKGANRQIKDKHNKSAADIAQEYDYNNIYEMLTSKGGLFEQCDTKPRLDNLKRTKTSLLFFFLLFFSITISVMYVIWPYVSHIEYLYAYVGLWISTYTLFTISWLKDPGYLRNFVKTKTNQEKFLETLDKYESCSICPECEIVKPRRSRHCEICKSCVQVFDHHCPWINNCVGARNHKYFLLFIFTLWIKILYMIAFIGLHVYIHTDPVCIYFPKSLIWQSAKLKFVPFFILKVAVSSIVIVVGFMFFLPLSFLVWVHLNNFVMNKTTSERFGFKAKKIASTLTSLTGSNNSDIMNSLISQSDKDPSQQSITGIENSQDIEISIQQKQYESPKESNISTTDKQQNCFLNCYAMCCLNQNNKKLLFGGSFKE